MRLAFLPRVVAAAALLLGAICAAPARGEFIRSFDVDLRVMPDGSLDVTETIVLDFENTPRHGINRFIPVRYERYANPYTVWLKVLEVTDGDGRKLQHKISRQGRDTNVRVGDPDVTVTGVHTYRLHYVARRAINFFDGGQPEIYWNATGNEWPYPIRSATLRLHPPPGLTTADVVRTQSFVGPPGSTRPGGVRFDASTLDFQSPGILQPGEGLTILARLPAGSVARPTWLRLALWFLADWWPAIVLPLATASFLFYRWHTKGRDVGAGAAIAVEWNPPKDLSPAEVGTLIDEKCDMPDVVSTLVDLAARGYLTIEEIESSGFLFLSSTDYEFTRLAEPPNAPPLLPHEREFLDGLFAGYKDRVRLSALKNKFYAYLPAIRSAIYESLTGKGFFATNPNTVRQAYMGAAIAIIVIGFMLSVVAAQLGYVAYGIGALAGGAIVLAFANAMPAKTWEGTRTLREVLGFQRFMALVEKERIAKLAKDDPTIFGRLLPYAMVLGVADQWAAAFAGLMTEPPNWYRSHHRGPFSPYLFINNLGHGMRTMGSTFSSRPSSSGGAGGGGSGFSGGSSGGGFGGGGGGSW